jgi:hypothetical protein
MYALPVSFVVVGMSGLLCGQLATRFPIASAFEPAHELVHGAGLRTGSLGSAGTAGYMLAP